VFCADDDREQLKKEIKILETMLHPVDSPEVCPIKGKVRIDKYVAMLIGMFMFFSKPLAGDKCREVSHRNIARSFKEAAVKHFVAKKLQ